MHGLIITAILLLMLGLAGAADYDDAVSEHDQYIDNVCAGVWPDYKNRGVDCGD